jgi:DNA helicase HerA-like ATPase
VQAARPDEVGAWLDRIRPERAALDVGELALARGVQLGLDAGGFGRHTFLCGQSGSGKTYALDVLLERVLMETSLRVVVLDPNSDYVRLGETHDEADASAVERFASAAGSIAVRSGASGAARVRVRFRDQVWLYLILVTQRPQKVHENVLSQCDNLVLMRMDSAADLAHIASIFSFVPPGLIDRATTFHQGEALVAGKIAPHPALIRFGARVTHEGGADVAGW